MVEIRQILCPVDFSESSRHALDHAVAIARWYGARVTVLHVVPTMPLAEGAAGGGASAGVYPLVAAAFDREQLAADLAGFVGPEPVPGVNFDLLVQEAPHVEGEILAQAARLPADLVVLGTHGRRGFSRFLLGSVTERVVRIVDCPVLTVPPRAPETVPLGPVLYKRILCAVDFSDTSLAALAFAMSIAQEADASLTVMHVIEMLPEVHDFRVASAHGLTDLRASAESQARERLHQLVPDTVRSFCAVEEVITSGRPYREILQRAADWQADLVVLGVSGRGAIDLALFGSTSEQIVRRAGCPVLTLRRQ